jgi:G3E family GTPase
VEFADVLVLNKTDLVTPQQQQQLAAVLARLNPGARLLPATHGRVEVGAVLNTHSFSMEKAQASPGWLVELNAWAEHHHHHHHHHEEEEGGHAEAGAAGQQEGPSEEDTTSTSSGSSTWPEAADQQQRPPGPAPEPQPTPSTSHAAPTTTTSSSRGGVPQRRSEVDAYGISSWVYTASRPFHPGRLLDIALAGTWPGVLRSKGFFWLASRHDVCGLWQSAGGGWQGEPR